MDLSKVKMVVSDMDGTLLNSKHEVSDMFFEQFQELRKRGIYFVAASGRQYHSILNKLKAIEDDIFIIAENGALVKDKEKELLITPIQDGLKEDLLSRIEGINGAHAMLCGKYTSYFDGKSLPFLDLLKEYYSSYEMHENFSSVTDEILKIAVYHDTSTKDFVYPEMIDFENQIKVKVSGPKWLDLNHINANKGYALNQLMQHLGIQKNEVLAFGDYYNDLEMLNLVDYSFAMGNAQEQVKEVAKYLTLSNNDFGVESVLEKLLNQ